MIINRQPTDKSFGQTSENFILFLFQFLLLVFAMDIGISGQLALLVEWLIGYRLTFFRLLS